MAKVTWTYQALEDINEIAEYLSKNSGSYASFIVDLILQRGDHLKNFPRLGRVVPETNIESIRELIVKDYRIVYTLPDLDNVQILSVRHKSG